MSDGTGRGDAGHPEPGWPFGSTGDAHGAPGPATSVTGARGWLTRRRLVLGLLAGVVAGAAVVAAVVGLPGQGAGPTPETVVLPSPTPTVAPAARVPVSAFADSLPASVLQLALVSQAEHVPWLAAGALEAYRLDYSDGGALAVTVLAGQWPNPPEAAAAYAAATAGAVPPDDGGAASGEVVVGGAVVGTWSAAAGADGTATVTWTNGTVMLQAVGPPDVVRDVYAAYHY